MRRPSSTSVSPSRRCGASGCAKPQSRQSKRSADQSSSAPHDGQVAASERHPSPSATQVTFAGAAAHTTCGSDAFATTARSGCASATAPPRVADRVHLAVAVELVAAEVAEHEQLGARAGRRPARRPARRPRAPRCPGSSARASVGAMPDVRLAPVELRDERPPVGARRRRRAGVSSWSCRWWPTRARRAGPAASSASRSGAIAFITRPLIVAPCAAPGDAREPAGGAPGRDRESRSCASARSRGRSHQ